MNLVESARTRRRRRRRATPPPTGLLLSTAQAEIPPYLALTRPPLAALLAEDACWQFEREHLMSVRPGFWHVRARLAWSREWLRHVARAGRIAGQLHDLVG